MAADHLGGDPACLLLRPAEAHDLDALAQALAGEQRLA